MAISSPCGAISNAFRPCMEIMLCMLWLACFLLSTPTCVFSPLYQSSSSIFDFGLLDMSTSYMLAWGSVIYTQNGDDVASLSLHTYEGDDPAAMIRGYINGCDLAEHGSISTCNLRTISALSCYYCLRCALRPITINYGCKIGIYYASPMIKHQIVRIFWTLLLSKDS